MKALSLHGPWAYYERKAAENECRIAELESELSRWKLQHNDLQQRLALTEADSKRLQEVQLPALQGEKEKSQHIIESLQAELARQRMQDTAEQSRLTAQVASLTHELQKLSADNTVLRSELAKTVHQKQLTSTKLDQIRKKLGLSESEAKAFIQELDDARAASKALREENKGLASDNAHLKQQVESRSQHCMTLIGENKRLLEQLADLRMQLQKQQGELWAAKTETHTAAAAARSAAQTAAAAGRKAGQVVVREWSQPGSKVAAEAAGSVGGAATGGGAGARRVSGKQNAAPPSAKIGPTSTATTGFRTSSAGGGAAPTCGVRAAANIPVGVVTPMGTDTAKAGLVRQALAVRQQRAALTQQQPAQQAQ